MTTIGYGDFFPKTTPGRILTFVLSIWGVIIVSLMVVALSTFVEPTNRQKKSFFMIKQLNNTDNVKEKSGNLIVSLYKAFKAYRKKPGFFQKIAFKAKVRKYRGNFRIYKNAVKNRRAQSLEEEISDVIITQNDLIKSELTRVRNRQIDILTGANVILDKIVYLRKVENPEEPSEKQTPKRKKKKKKRFKKKLPKGTGLSDLESSNEDTRAQKKGKNKNKKSNKTISQFNPSLGSIGYE